MKTWQKIAISLVFLTATIVAVPKVAFYVLARAMASIIPRAEDVVFADFSHAKSDAEILMDRARVKGATQAEPLHIMPAEFPASLRLKAVAFTVAYPDHLSLVMHSNPEFMVGARFWRNGASPPARDKPTRYPNVTFFSIDKNIEKVGENRL